MATRREPTAWTGWIGFAAILLTLIGAITFFEGLVGIVRHEYYVVSGDAVLLFSLKSWGWIMLFWGILLFLVGLGLASRAGWARWAAVVIVALNLIAQLGYLGNTQYPLWALVIIALEVTVLYALTARWADADVF